MFDGEGVDEFGGITLQEYRRNLQMVFQDSFASLNPRLTDAEDHRLRAARARVGRREARARPRACWRGSGCSRRSSPRATRTNSRAASGSASTSRAPWPSEPRLLILDEAVAALDKSVQAQVLNLLQELSEEQGLTYLFISHDLHVVQYLSDRVMVMYLGQVVEVGPVEQHLRRHPRHPYTRALLSAVPSMDPAGPHRAAAAVPEIRPTRSTRPVAAASATAARRRERVCASAAPPLHARRPAPGH